MTKDLCKKVCEEFEAQGFKKNIDPRTFKESYGLSKQADGNWFKITKTGLHSDLTKSLIELSAMPFFKELTDAINERDPEFQKIGGRIFITENLVYKIKKGTEYPIIIEDNSVEKVQNQSSRYAKLCEEMASQGHSRDRFRIEETYLISKSAGGEWSITSTHENHTGKKTLLNLAKMPQLKILADKINKLEPLFQSNGGRLFITPTRIYRIKNKIELDFNFEKSKGRAQ